MLEAFYIFLLSFAGGILGRLGGDGAGRLFRLLGVPACCIAIMVIMYHPLNWWYYGALLLSFGAILGATSTYDKAKGSPVLWYNWLAYGAMEGLSFLPIVIFTQHWLGFSLRMIVCAVMLMLWDDEIGLDWLEEFGRYFIIVLSTIIIVLV